NPKKTAAVRQIAFLRGINVGKAKRIAMADLRALIEKLGFTGVSTLLNSGNVVFTSTNPDCTAVAGQIEQAILKKHGFFSKITVISGEDLAVIISENPLLDVANDHSRFLVALFPNLDDRLALEPLLKQDWKPDQ